MREFKNSESETDKSKALVFGIALSEIVHYIIQCKELPGRSPVFKLCDIKSRYIQTIVHYGGDPESVHSTRLKEKLVNHIPELQALKKGRDVLLTFEENSGEALFDACSKDLENDGMVLAKAADIVRKDIFSSFPEFEGSFDADYVKSSVPFSLVYLVRMLLEGTNCPADNETVEDADIFAQDIAQLIRYNATKQKHDGGNRRHKLERETPLPVYVGLMLHSKTRKAGVIDKLASFGLSISSDRIENIQTSITEVLCDRYKRHDLVCPPCLQHGFFITAVIDNIDLNNCKTYQQLQDGISMVPGSHFSSIQMKQLSTNFLSITLKVEVVIHKMLNCQSTTLTYLQ